MPSPEIDAYYAATHAREIRPELIYAESQVGEPRIAIDCGCGAGADIAYLLAHGFKVYGFDIEAASINRCEQRFAGNPEVILSKADFSAYTYPRASLIVADASLFFCPRFEFNGVWEKIVNCLYPNGIFCGSFLGPEDTMAGVDYDREAFWPEVSVFNKLEVESLFNHLEVLRFTEHKKTGTTPQGTPHDWHIFSVVARKLA